VNQESSEEGLGNERIVDGGPNQQIHFIGKCGNEGLERRARGKEKVIDSKADDKRNLGDAPGVWVCNLDRMRNRPTTCWLHTFQKTFPASNFTFRSWVIRSMYIFRCEGKPMDFCVSEARRWLVEHGAGFCKIQRGLRDFEIDWPFE